MNTMKPAWFALLALACVLGESAAANPGPARFPDLSDDAEIHHAIDEARQEALDTDRLLMVVLGADWCHDSRDFLDYFDNREFAALVEERYVVQRVSVGYYDHVRGVVGRWGLPVIYGTPTVVIVEPASGTVLNRDSLSKWRNAAMHEPRDAVEYFDDFQAGPPPAPEPTSAALRLALAKIDAFERLQAERIYIAYAELGEEMRDLGDTRPGPDFRRKWDSLARMRSDITADLAAMRARARELDRQGVTDIPVDYPHYPLFIDSTDS